MIPQIQCNYHPGKDIVIIDLGKNKTANSRLFCLNCVENNELRQPFSIERFLDLAKQFKQKKVSEINEENDYLKIKFSKIQKQVIIMKELMMNKLDRIQEEIENLTSDFQKWTLNEESYYSDLITEVTQTKLEKLSKLLSGDEIPGSITDYIKDILQQFQKDIAFDFRHLIAEQNQLIHCIDNTLNPKLFVQNEINLPKPCSILLTNQQQSIVVGAVADQIVIWSQIQSKLIEQLEIKAHVGTITGLALYNTGNIVSGGGYEDKSLKLWYQDQLEWSCIQTLSFATGIMSLSVTPDQEQLIMSTQGRQISIFIMIQGQLEIIQNLNESHPSIHFTISQNSEILATSSWKNYINVYFQNLDFCQWNYYQNIETAGQIHRICFTNDEEFICQQQNPPRLLIYQVNKKGPFEVIQELQLSESDDNNVFGFPIIQIQRSIYCKNEQFFYVITKSKANKYEIKYIIAGEFTAGCIDSNGTRLIVKNESNNKIETFGDE